MCRGHQTTRGGENVKTAVAPVPLAFMPAILPTSPSMFSSVGGSANKGWD